MIKLEDINKKEWFDRVRHEMNRKKKVILYRQDEEISKRSHSLLSLRAINKLCKVT